MASAEPLTSRVQAGDGGAAARRGRSARLRTGRFLVEGPQAVREALAREAARPGPSRAVRHRRRRRSATRDLLAAAAAAGLPVHAVERRGAWRRSRRPVTPQGIVAVCAFVDVPAGGRCVGAPAAAGRRAGPGARPGQRRHRDPRGRRRRRRRRRAHRRAASTRTTPSASGRPPAASSTCRSSPASRWPRRSPALRAAGLRGAGRRRRRRATSTTSTPPAPAGRARPPGCSATRPGACRRRRCALADAVVRVPIHGRGGEPQPGHRRRRLPVRLGPRAAPPRRLPHPVAPRRPTRSPPPWAHPTPGVDQAAWAAA